MVDTPKTKKKDKWPVRPSLPDGIVTEEVSVDEDGAFETDDDATIDVVADGIADDRGATLFFFIIYLFFQISNKFKFKQLQWNRND